MDVEICLDPWNKPHGVVFFACIADFGLLTLFFSFLFFFEEEEGKEASREGKGGR